MVYYKKTYTISNSTIKRRKKTRRRRKRWALCQTMYGGVDDIDNEYNASTASYTKSQKSRSNSIATAVSTSAAAPRSPIPATSTEIRKGIADTEKILKNLLNDPNIPADKKIEIVNLLNETNKIVNKNNQSKYGHYKKYIQYGLTLAAIASLGFLGYKYNALILSVIKTDFVNETTSMLYEKYHNTKEFLKSRLNDILSANVFMPYNIYAPQGAAAPPVPPAPENPARTDLPNNAPIASAEEVPPVVDANVQNEISRTSVSVPVPAPVPVPVPAQTDALTKLNALKMKYKIAVDTYYGQLKITMTNMISLINILIGEENNNLKLINAVGASGASTTALENNNNLVETNERKTNVVFKEYKANLDLLKEQIDTIIAELAELEKSITDNDTSLKKDIKEFLAKLGDDFKQMENSRADYEKKLKDLTTAYNKARCKQFIALNNIDIIHATGLERYYKQKLESYKHIDFIKEDKIVYWGVISDVYNAVVNKRYQQNAAQVADYQQRINVAKELLAQFQMQSLKKSSILSRPLKEFIFPIYSDKFNYLNKNYGGILSRFFSVPNYYNYARGYAHVDNVLNKLENAIVKANTASLWYSHSALKRDIEYIYDPFSFTMAIRLFNPIVRDIRPQQDELLRYYYSILCYIEMYGDPKNNVELGAKHSLFKNIPILNTLFVKKNAAAVYSQGYVRPRIYANTGNIASSISGYI